MIRRSSLLFFMLVSGLFAQAAALRSPADRLAPDDPAWADLARAMARRPDATAGFSEKRFFAFRKTPLPLRGESRLSATLGLSLHYTTPEDRIVIVDDRGMLVRQTGADTAAPADPRAAAANAALVQVLRFDLAALSANFAVFGQRDGAQWTLALVPRAAELQRVVTEIVVVGDGPDVRQITLRHSTKQYVEITVGAPALAPFTADERRRFFR